MKHAAAPLGRGCAIIRHVYLLHYTSITGSSKDRRNIYGKGQFWAHLKFHFTYRASDGARIVYRYKKYVEGRDFLPILIV